jgi:hypothetical protein
MSQTITICNKLYTLDTTEVNLIGYNLSEFPMEIFKLHNLEELYLQENKINNLPKEIGLLKKLKIFNLEDNNISSIPSEIGMLTNLEYFNISNNKLTTMPDEIGMLHILKDLYLENNILSDFSPSICNLSNLEILSLADNNIISIPSNINNMHGLQELFLRDNQITHIPVELCELENLNELIIRNNQITELPLEITNLENLTLFQYYGNPIENFLHPRIHAFVDRLLYLNHTNVIDNNIYADSQNIHTSSIQQNTKDSIIRLLQQMQQLEDGYEYDYITDSELSDKCKEALVEYSEDMTIHTQLNSNFKDILMAVFYEISQLSTDAQTFAKQRLNEEMMDSECKCFTGRITRLINSLSGISDKVIIKISDSEEIGNVISVARTKFEEIDEIKEYVRKDLEERGYTEEVISEWIEYIE